VDAGWLGMGLLLTEMTAAPFGARLPSARYALHLWSRVL
jgi:hypothetical protein